ncbi:MAG: phenylalanine--tRNA ligase subunit beta, partial [Athalassotoga sp.]
MKLSVEWLKDYVDIDGDIQKLSDDLTMSGSEVEEIEKPFEKIKGVISAKIIDVKPHPNADNLNVCKVSDGSKTYTIVTSDKSLKINDFVAFGPADLATDVDGKIVRSVDMRGIKTDGMLFSLEELGLESHSSRVFRFEKPAPMGEDIVKIFDLDQTVFEIEITPN